MTEAVEIIGKAIGKPNLAYVHLSEEQVRPALIQIGMLPNVADLILDCPPL